MLAITKPTYPSTTPGNSKALIMASPGLTTSNVASTVRVFKNLTLNGLLLPQMNIGLEQLVEKVHQSLNK